MKNRASTQLEILSLRVCLMEVLPSFPHKAWQVVKCLSHHSVHELSRMEVLSFCPSLPFQGFMKRGEIVVIVYERGLRTVWKKRH